MPFGSTARRFQAPATRAVTPSSANGDAQLSDVESVFGDSSGRYDGTGDFNRLGTTGLSFPAGSPFTAEAFARADNFAVQFRGIVGFGNTHASGGSQFNLYFRTQSGTTTIWTARGFNLIIAGNTTVAANTWYHCALQRHANNLCELYVNGVRQSTTSTQNNTIGQNTGGTIGIFTDRSQNPLLGYVDEVRISNIARYSGSSFTVTNKPFVNDEHTIFLCHMDGEPGSTNFVDDNT